MKNNGESVKIHVPEKTYWYIRVSMFWNIRKHIYLVFIQYHCSSKYYFCTNCVCLSTMLTIAHTAHLDC